jgi:hypothetical protein
MLVKVRPDNSTGVVLFFSQVRCGEYLRGWEVDRECNQGYMYVMTLMIACCVCACMYVLHFDDYMMVNLRIENGMLDHCIWFASQLRMTRSIMFISHRPAVTVYSSPAT